jgi:hypothetical protein
MKRYPSPPVPSLVGLMRTTSHAFLFTVALSIAPINRLVFGVSLIER